MRRRLCAAAATAALVTLISALPATASTTPATATATATVPASASTAGAGTVRETTITLVTGDQVTVTTAGDTIRSVSPQTGPGRSGITFFTSSDGPDDISVIPSDAMDLLGEGRLDPRLFRVGTLLEFGYDDKQRSDLPLIAQYGRGASRAGRVRAEVGAEGRVRRELPRLGLTALEPRKADAARLWKELTEGGTLRGGVTKLWLDGRAKVALDRSVPQIGAPEAWAAGYTGKGVTVAVLDTGYDSDHPDLAGKVDVAEDFTGSGSAEDTVGHGTHVASTIAGTGTAPGVAPDARLAIGRVCVDEGCPDSAILAGMDWAANTLHAKVVNLSLGGPDEAGIDPLEQAVDDLSARTGTLFVLAAGNEGENGKQTVGSPGSADAALTVGAVGRDESLAYFSSVGPRVGDFAVKPDITAPGVGIVAAKLGGGHVALSGTSMATPHVAGSAALVAQAHPGWPGDRIKAALMGAAKPKDALTPYDQGSGRVDVARATAQQVTASPANISETADWAAGSGEDTVHEVTYSNAGTAPVTLGLDIATPVSSDGKPGNPAQFTMGTDKVVVPAGGSASVEVTVLGTMLPHGAQSAVLTASSADGAASVRTLLAAYSPIPTHQVTVGALDRSGKATSSYVELVNRYSGANYYVTVRDGVGSTSVPEGEYYLVAGIRTVSDASNAMVVMPVTVDRTLTVTADARTAVPVPVSLDAADAQGVALEASVSLPFGGSTKSFSAVAVGATAFDTLYVSPFADPDVTYRTSATFAERGADATTPSSFFYHVVDRHSGGVPEDLAFSAKRRNLTRVDADYRAQGTAASGVTGTAPYDAGHPTTMIDQPVAFPSRVRDYRTPGSWVDRVRIDGRHALSDTPHEFGPGKSNKLTWGAAVVGPAVPDLAMLRTADRIAMGNLRWAVDADATHDGTDWGAAGRLVLESGGKTYADWNAVGLGQSSVAVPAEEAQYTLRGSVTRTGAYAALSTRIDSEWTFTSGHAPDGAAVPLMAVRFAAGGLDAYGRARAHSATGLDLTVDRSPYAAEAVVGTPSLEVSHDDGATWQRVRVKAATPGHPARASLTNRGTGGYISLRAEVTADDGSKVVQTIIRAYAVKAH
ncbi:MULTISPECIES: S8 family serine peptidase [unclassified Streptomyces]|uniref:S8 family peptidase n=1 Tax=unclassified Streptomyces TaxID=2593676 RepID=UPI0036E982D1